MAFSKKKKLENLHFLKSSVAIFKKMTSMNCIFLSFLLQIITFLSVGPNDQIMVSVYVIMIF